jgi:hypothetical protein
MAQLTPIQLEDGTIIYIEATEAVSAPVVSSPGTSEESGRVSKGGEPSQGMMIQSFKAIEGTIRAYTQ